MSSSALAARGPDAVSDPCRPSLAEDDVGPGPAQQASGDRAPATPEARVRVLARVRVSHVVQPACLVVQQAAPVQDHAGQRERPALWAAVRQPVVRQDAARLPVARRAAARWDEMIDSGPPAPGAPALAAPQAPDGRHSAWPPAGGSLAAGWVVAEKSRGRRVWAPVLAASPMTLSRRTAASQARPEHSSEPERPGFARHYSPGHFQIQWKEEACCDPPSSPTLS